MSVALNGQRVFGRILSGPSCRCEDVPVEMQVYQKVIEKAVMPMSLYKTCHGDLYFFVYLVDANYVFWPYDGGLLVVKRERGCYAEEFVSLDDPKLFDRVRAVWKDLKPA